MILFINEGHGEVCLSYTKIIVEYSSILGTVYFWFIIAWSSSGQDDFAKRGTTSRRNPNCGLRNWFIIRLAGDLISYPKDLQCMFGNQVANTTFDNPSTVRCLTPPTTTPGSVQFYIGTFATTLVFYYYGMGQIYFDISMIIVNPEIYSFSPDRGTTEGGVNVTIHGKFPLQNSFHRKIFRGGNMGINYLCIWASRGEQHLH